MFICENPKEQAEVVDRARDSLDSLFPFSLADSSFCKSSRDDKYDKHAKNEHIKSVEPDYLPIESKERGECEQRRRKLCSSSGNSLNIPTTPPPSSRESAGTHPNLLHMKTLKPQLPVLQTAKKHYNLAVDYQTYRRSARSTHYDDTVFSYIAKSVKKVKSQMRVHCFDPKNRIPIIKFMATVTLACNSNKIHEDDGMWVLPHYAMDNLANANSRRMCAEDWPTFLAASGRNK